MPQSQLNKNDPYSLQKVQPKKPSPVPKSLNDLQSSPKSRKRLLSMLDGNSPQSNKQKACNLSLDKGLENEKNTNRNRSDFLPKIYNPEAENRLKALMDLLKRKNTALPPMNHSPPKEVVTEDIINKVEQKDKNGILPPLIISRPKSSLKSTSSILKRKFANSPNGKASDKAQPEVLGSSVPIENKKRVVIKASPHKAGKNFV